jgi:hypothetical protein
MQPKHTKVGGKRQWRKRREAVVVQKEALELRHAVYGSKTGAASNVRSMKR